MRRGAVRRSERLRTIRSARSMTVAAKEAAGQGLRVGFVPTMGFLHEGHLRLIEAAAAETDLAVVSIFVNPLQFGPREDFKRYPRNVKRDSAVAAARGCDVLFVPSAKTMYPERFRTSVRVRGLEGKLCGRSRPGHFEGVCTVVMKLLNIVRPDRLYLGQKDAQQAIILERMIGDMDMGVSVRVRPTVREPDGLAMSSRNVYLTPEERREAPGLYRALKVGARAIRGGEKDPAEVKRSMMAVMRRVAGARTEYLEAVDVSSLETPKAIRGKTLLAGAVWFGRTRLIDNVIVNAPRKA
jgi:pantoate--beta-alanine ligase